MSQDVPATTRRQFMKLATAAAAAPAINASAVESTIAPPSKSPERQRKKSTIAYPRTFSGKNLSRIAFPVGGIGTGGLELGGRGNLCSCQIFNRAADHETLAFVFPAIHVRAHGRPDFSSFLESQLLPPFDIHDNGVRLFQLPGMPRFEDATFHGSFPIARIEFADRNCPVKISLEAFSPFFPVDIESSGLPAAVLQYTVHNPLTVPAEVSIAWSFQNPSSRLKEGVNVFQEGKLCSGTMMSEPSLPADSARRGTFALCTLADPQSTQTYLSRWTDLGGSSAIDHFWGHFSTGALPPPPDSGSSDNAAVATANISHRIPPGQSRTFRFLFAWHYPIRTPENCGWDPIKGHEKDVIGNHYSTQFKDAWDVAEHISKNLPALETQTRDFVDVIASSTLPEAVKDAAASNLSTLVSNTLFRIADGSFHAFEGCGNNVGLGFGSCTHVWNYETATSHVFPAISRSMREVSFGYVTDAEGHMDFRHKLPLGIEHWGQAAADGQMGQIVRLYQDWRVSGDTAWMKSLWPAAKRALAYAWQPGGWDADKDGVMEGAQHNTYDVEFMGPNALCEVWYLAALRAASFMAEAVGDAEFAHEVTQRFERGRTWTDSNLFNGEFYIQQIRPAPKSQVAPRLLGGAVDPANPKFQLGGACHADQLVGQQIATLAGLGDLLSHSHIRTTLASIERYNYKPDLSQWRGSLRTYALNHEAAIVICDYSKGGKPAVPVNYYSENWTGVEYSVAQLMCLYGMQERGISHVEDIRRRFDGEKRNPYDESEYGHHYTRAMSSWGLIPTLSGFRYDAVLEELTITPIYRIAGNFKCIWTASNGWGYFSLGGGYLEIIAISGTLRVRNLIIALRETVADSFDATSANQRVDSHFEPRSTNGKIQNVRFSKVVTISPEAPFSIRRQI